MNKAFKSLINQEKEEEKRKHKLKRFKSNIKKILIN
jgi:hypothetical protein